MSNLEEGGGMKCSDKVQLKEDGNVVKDQTLILDILELDTSSKMRTLILQCLIK